MIDSHCHLASHKFSNEELPDIIARAEANGVTRMVTLATCLEDAKTNIAISEKFPQVFTAIGIHPCDVHETPDNYLVELHTLASHQKCVAIGETGLDYYHPAPDGWSADDYHQRQRDFLRQHFELAKELGKNVVIHTRDRSGKQSMDDAIAIYREFAHDVKAVFHCFLGPLENASEIFELGGYISFTGIATFKSAKDCIQAAVDAPAGRFMVETDSPYLAPTPYRGKRNEPAYTLHTAEAIAASRGETLHELNQHTNATAQEFFKFPA
ncbi:TatD DNase family protein [Rubritalea squalenifaciens DSM 18772]|uniref:TatD DNase family protein n=1 Tax=Rubritalea squalenifaciens DSM 18772 TaxID=1123071 RepID=A0A1M6NVT8_9BACT|nr:TatD family hydrolase [Rubritalea squalenifaciens]SHJ99859.1 TatD DNase family protein [Rubritalea squalenifaciens DSM 18772]